MPIGNVTSQIFANIYLNELDQFVKHNLKVKYYFRYADDFIILHQDYFILKNWLSLIGNFLKSELFLELHPNKIKIRKFSRGIDFLGYVVLPRYIVLRTKTKRRMFRKLLRKELLLESDIITPENYNQSLQSYLGMIKHGNNYKIRKEVLRNYRVNQ